MCRLGVRLSSFWQESFGAAWAFLSASWAHTALRRYTPYTVTTWTFIIAAIGSILISHPADMIAKISVAPSIPGLLGFSLLTALVTAVIPFLAYTLGLRSVEASKAGILATVEPMVATLIGIFVFSEPLTLMSGVGVLLILAAVVILNVSNENSRHGR